MAFDGQPFDQLVGVEAQRALRSAVKPAIPLAIAREPVPGDDRFIDRELRDAAARAADLNDVGSGIRSTT